MSKLAIILEDMRLGGPQKQLIYFLQECSKSNSSKKYLVILPKQSKKKLSKFLNLNKIKIKELDIQYLSRYSITKYIRYFYKEFKQIKDSLRNIEKVYIAGGTSSLKSLIFSIILKKQIYFHIHDARTNKILKIILFFLSFFIKKIFFASKSSRDYYSFLSNNPNKITLRSSIDPYYFKNFPKKKNIFNIGIISNINPDKNIELLIDIVKNINNKKIKFILVGKLFSSQINYFRNELNLLDEIKNNIKWHKNIDDPKEIIKSFDLYICTSKNESLPLSILEALSMSIPVISTNVGDVSYVLNKIKCGFIAKPNCKNFVEKIKILYSNRNKLKKLSINAKKNILKNFNIKDYKRSLENELFKK